MIADKARLQRIVANSLLAKQLCREAGAVVALVADNGTEVVEVGCGVNSSTTMEIGSLTKIFTALLLAEAIGRDELKLSDRIDDVLFEVRWAGEPAITVGELATHTSGLPRLSFGGLNALRSDPYRGYTREDLMIYLRRTQPRSPAHPVFGYSNLGYAVLGMALEKAAAQPFEHLLRERLLGPMGLGQTALQLAGDSDLARGGYNRDGGGASLWHMDVYAPCGAMVSTLEDLALAVQSFLNADSPIAGALALTTEPRAKIAGGSVGLGWMLPDAGSAFWHNGATAGYSAYLGVNTMRRMGVVVLANQVLPGEMTELGTELMRMIRAASTVNEGAE